MGCSFSLSWQEACVIIRHEKQSAVQGKQTTERWTSMPLTVIYFPQFTIVDMSYALHV